MTNHSTQHKSPRLFHLLFFGASVMLVISATAAALQNVETKPGDSAAPAMTDEQLAVAGKKATDEFCTLCHDLDEVTGFRRTPREWNDSISAMVERGARGTDEQLATVQRYLTRYFGRVKVNTATAAELSSVLGLSPKDAAAVVDYRKTHGEFPDAAALLKVPGIDKTKIDAQPDALLFD